MKWKEYTFIDPCLSFWLHTAPKLYSIYPCRFTHRSSYKTRCNFCVLHYLDDFWTLQYTYVYMYVHQYPTFVSEIWVWYKNQVPVCVYLWLFRTQIKCLSTALSYLLGITANIKARHPEEKSTRIRQFITSWLNSKKAPKHEISCLIGLLQCRVLESRCIFNVTTLKLV